MTVVNELTVLLSKLFMKEEIFGPVKMEEIKLPMNEPEKQNNNKEIKETKRPSFSLEYYPKGLANLGNTCFFNSSMQLMNASDSFVQGVFNRKCKKGLNCELFNFFTTMRSSKGSTVFNPSSFHHSVRSATKKFTSFSQEDSNDLILSILDTCIEEDKAILMSSKEEKRKLHAFLKTGIGSTVAFYLAGQVTCLECKFEDWVFDPCLDLALPLSYTEDILIVESDFIKTQVMLPECRARKAGKYDIAYKRIGGIKELRNISVKDYIKHFMALEALYDKSNLFKCPKCKKPVKSHHQFMMLDPPDCLFVSLKRFKRDGFMVRKNGKSIANDLVLDLTNYVIQEAGVVNRYVYKLVGFTNHGGSLSGGHYTAYVRNGDKYTNK